LSGKSATSSCSANLCASVQMPSLSAAASMMRRAISTRSGIESCEEGVGAAVVALTGLGATRGADEPRKSSMYGQNKTLAPMLVTSPMKKPEMTQKAIVTPRTAGAAFEVLLGGGRLERVTRGHDANVGPSPERAKPAKSRRVAVQFLGRSLG